MILSIREELKQTNLEIKEKMEQQQALMDTLNFYASDSSISMYKTLVKADGVHLPTIRINSWKTISSAKIELLKPEDIRILSDIEQQRNVLDMKVEYIMNYLNTNINKKDIQTKNLIQILMQEICITEKFLQEDIEVFLDGNL